MPSSSSLSGFVCFCLVPLKAASLSSHSVYLSVYSPLDNWYVDAEVAAQSWSSQAWQWFTCTQSMCWEQQYHTTSPGAGWLLGIGSVKQVSVIHSSQDCFFCSMQGQQWLL